MRRAVAIALAFVAFVAVTLAPMARAVAPTQTGWWWSGHLSQLPVNPPPPDVAKGGLYVAGGLTGASGVSALRFDLSDGASAPTLTLRIARSSGTVVLGACRTSGPWQPAEAGAWDARPEPDCAKGSVAAELTTEGGHAVTRFALAALVDGDALDVLLLPGKDPATGTDATFDVSFDPPGPEALAVTTTPAPDGGKPSSPATQSGSQAPSSVGSTPPPLPAATPTPAVPFTPAANASRIASKPDAVNSAPVASAPASTSGNDADGRIAGLVLGALVVAAWIVTARTRLGVQLRALNGDAGQELRGIGRFAAPRDSSPPPL